MRFYFIVTQPFTKISKCFPNFTQTLNGLRFHFLLCCFLCIISSCTTEDEEISRSFYYWQSNFQLSVAEKHTLENLEIKKLYIKFFDIKWEASAGQPIPVASIQFREAIPENIHFVPVIFITNETLLNLNSEEIKTLAFKTSKKLEDILQENKLATPGEIQLDCDWNASTSEKYFLLIEEMKKFPSWEKTQWSATLRLHQIKYAEDTGIPPVNRGMLMFYNMGNIEDLTSKNSIYEKEIAGSYLEKVSDYPLPLDAAIACYSWGLLFEHNRLLKIFYPLYAQNIPDSLFAKQGENIFTAKDNFYFEGTFINSGNTLKLETMSPQLSLESAEILAGEMKNKPFSVILYHLDSNIVNNYSDENFEAIFSAFE